MATEQQHANGAYTLEQIMSAGETVAAHLPDSRDRADFRKRLNDVYARLQPMPKLKTPEERVVVEFITQQSAWVVKRDGKIVADGLEQEVAHWCRNGLIAAKGK